MSYLLEVLGRGLLAELAAAFRDILADPDQFSTRTLREAARAKGAKAEEHRRFAIRLLNNHDYFHARESFQRALAQDSQDVAALAGVACALDELGKTEEALEHLLRAQGIVPDVPALIFAIGCCRERLGQTGKAKQCYERTLEQCPYLRNARERLAAIHVREDDIPAAVAQYEQLCMDEPDDVSTHIALANLYFRNNNVDEAVHRFRLALTIDPDNWEARDDLVNVYDQQGLIDEAIVEMLETISSEPAFPDNHLRLGDLLVKKGDEERALDEYMEAVRLHPDYLEASVKVGTMHLRLGNYDGAARWFNKCVEINDRLLGGYVGLACAQMEAGKPAEAEETIEMAARIAPNSSMLFSETARLQLQSAVGRQAVEYLDPITPPSPDALAGPVDSLLDGQIMRHAAALNEHPNHADLHYRYGLLLRERGRFDDAIGAFRRALEINPNYVKATVKLGLALMENGSREEAVDTLQKALKDDPRDVELHYQLGLVFADGQKFSLALEQFDEALTHDPRNLDIHANVALALQNMGLLDRATMSWQTLCETAPSSERGKAVLQAVDGMDPTQDLGGFSGRT